MCVFLLMENLEAIASAGARVIGDFDPLDINAKNQTLVVWKSSKSLSY